MQHAQNINLAEAWFQAFNSKDLDLLLSLYDENAVHYSPKLKLRLPETGGMIAGKAELSKWWSDAFARIPDLHYQIIHILADETIIFMEYLRIAAGDEDLRVMEVLEITNNVITASRVYHS